MLLRKKRGTKYEIQNQKKNVLVLSSLQISLVDEIRKLEETFNVLHERTESESVDGYASYPPTDKYGRFALCKTFKIDKRSYFSCGRFQFFVDT